MNPDPTDPLFSIVPVVVIVGSVVVGVLFVVGIGIAVHRALRLRSQGVNPLTLQEDLAVRALHSGALAPGRTKAERLAELDGLLATGAISPTEHREARARVLEG